MQLLVHYGFFFLTQSLALYDLSHLYICFFCCDHQPCSAIFHKLYYLYLFGNEEEKKVSLYHIAHNVSSVYYLVVYIYIYNNRLMNCIILALASLP